MPDYLQKHLKHRCFLARKLRAEVVGPDPTGVASDVRAKYTWEEFRSAKKQTSGEELLWQDPPTKRYGAGILYPIGVSEDAENVRTVSDQNTAELSVDAFYSADDDAISQNKSEPKIRRSVDLDESDDYAVSLANAYKPAAIGLSFIADFSRETVGISIQIVNAGRISRSIVDSAPSGFYKAFDVDVVSSSGSLAKRKVWARSPLLSQNGACPIISIGSREVLDTLGPIKRWVDERLGLEVVVVARGEYSHLSNNQRLITVSLVNHGFPNAKTLDEQCLFQSGIKVDGQSSDEWIIPYPENLLDISQDTDPLADENVNNLLYRRFHTFAVGHGCATDWESEVSNNIGTVWTDVLPSFESPSVSSDLKIQSDKGDFKNLRVSMWKLGGLDTASDGFDEINQLIEAYKYWISSLRSDLASIVPKNMHKTGTSLIEKCELCLDRIIRGRDLLLNDSANGSIREAFKLANKSMLIARLRGGFPTRFKTSTDDENSWNIPYTPPDLTKIDPSEGYWRPFQIAFMLMSLEGVVKPESADRDVVDLIWFPTGGGKTEAYLGLTSFAIFFNRLEAVESHGADVIMRYTLRLLTAQQFQRASVLFCAMETLRWSNKKLGDKRFSIGLWVGGSTTPNKRADAIAALKQLEKNSDAENPFVLLKCPWCGSKFGPSNHDHKGVLGYEIGAITNADPKTVLYRCSDVRCEFGKANKLSRKPPLPIVVIDEDLLDSPPNLLIGTVDKFAMLAWNPKVRSFFGINSRGKHTGLPPTLIIQDELHLISGPLGSMVGAYETVIETLCRKDGTGHIRPKIVASTATISRSREQILHLYARKESMLFPPSGLDVEDSFFSKVARDSDGTMLPGRQYMGIMAPGHGSLQTTQSRVYASLVQNASLIDDEPASIDPWWTLLCFYNAIRELGAAATLFVSDVREYLRIIIDRDGIDYKKIRKLFNISELTSRIRSDQVPKELESLERKLINNEPLDGAKNREVIDACLASNIIEVGVDVARLSVMAIVGQPKTTSQYIQVSSRVGRDSKKPGLVAVMYGQSKPRDRSHYERFRQYHQKIYSHVEPTSVTPFSPPAVDRSLHGIIVSLVRQLGDMDVSKRPDPFPLSDTSKLKQVLENMLEERVNLVCPEEEGNVFRVLNTRLKEWLVWNPSEYGDFGVLGENSPLMYPAGATIPQSWDSHSWPTMSSLRNVDATCEAEVTQFFNEV